MATSIGEFFSNFFSNLGDGLNSLKDGIGSFFSSLGNSIGGFFNSLWNNIYNFFKDLPGHIANIWSSFIELLQYVNPFSENFLGRKIIELLGNLLNYLFVPSDELWNEHINHEIQIKDKLNNKFGIISFFSSEYEKAKDYVYSSDFLNIKIPSWSFNLGVIHFETEEKSFINVRDAYEPYRQTVRTSIMYISIALFVVYIVKYFLNYGSTAAGQYISKNDGGGKE